MTSLPRGNRDPLSLSQKATINQLAAIAWPQYEIGVLDGAAFGGDGQMLLRRWTIGEILTAFDWLRWKNAQRCEIYVRPAGEHAYTLLDDLDRMTIGRMRQEGFAPSVIVESSPNNMQAWLYHGETLPAAVSTEAARILAERFGGDPSSADWRHFGRLAGFTNNKPKHRQSNELQPFVLLHEHKRCVYRQAPAVIEEARLRVERARAAAIAARAAHRGNMSVTLQKSIVDFHADPRYAGDLNRADLAYAIYALSRGSSSESIAAALRQRDLSKKGTPGRQEAYIERTLRKAAKAAYGNETR